jgi:SAM-dependent methyltransferase
MAEILRDWLPASGLVLEIASGTGEHALYFAQAFPDLEWQPSDVSPDALASISAWRSDAEAANLRAPIALDSSAGDWPIKRADAILCSNMAHISPWEASLGLLDGAARVLADGGPLILYGPWLIDSVETSASNLAFDQDLKQRDPRWGLRRVEDLADAAAKRGLALIETRAMPANNRMLLLRLVEGQR